jgi:nucleotide-binding universal stress UspA family protein
MFAKVVWATDGSENADRALGYAVQIAERDGAELHVVHVVQKFAGSRVAGQDQRSDEPEIDDKIARQTARLRVEHPLETRLHRPRTTGDVGKRIAELAQRQCADLIVVGTRGHSAFAAAILGSVTQQLLHVAHCPVLAVPPIAHAAAPPQSTDALLASS